MCESDGSNIRKLTSIESGYVGQASWSPDGERIAFTAFQDGPAAIFLARTEGGPSHKLAELGGSQHSPNWSRDGRFVYFNSNHGGSDQVWKIPAEGGEAIEVTPAGGPFLAETRDGESLFYCQIEAGTTRIYRMPVTGGPRTEVLQYNGGLQNGLLVPEGIYFMETSSESRHELKYLNFATRQTTLVVELERFPNWCMTISPDGRRLVYPRIDQSSSDLMLVEDFH